MGQPICHDLPRQTGACCAAPSQLCQAFAKIFDKGPAELDMHVIYDVSHNIAKMEEHLVDGTMKRLLVCAALLPSALPARCCVRWCC